VRLNFSRHNIFFQIWRSACQERDREQDEENIKNTILTCKECKRFEYFILEAGDVYSSIVFGAPNNQSVLLQLFLFHWKPLGLSEKIALSIKICYFYYLSFYLFFLALIRNEELREKIEFVMSNYIQFE